MIICKECRFYDAINGTATFSGGECRINPPALVTPTPLEGFVTWKTYHIFPIVKEDFWCGKAIDDYGRTNLC